jgi:hypothetical protein
MRYEGKTFSGRALLETSEIIFRGDTRLKIPFPAITKVQSRGGELHVRTKEGLAVFDLGTQAEKWCKKITNPKTVVEKLGVKAGDIVSLIGAFPAEFIADLKKAGAAIREGKTSKDAAWHFLASESQKGLSRVKTISKNLSDGAGLWIVYPKGQKSIAESDVRAAGLKAGLTDVKVVGFSATHTALKFVVPLARRKG